MAILDASARGHDPGTRRDSPPAPAGDGPPERIAVTEQGGRLFVTITRRGTRCFALSPDEGVYLAEQLTAILAERETAGVTS
jgi:hypothetical protein